VASRLSWWLAAALVLAGSVWISVSQEPWPNPFEPRPGLTSLDWWRYPVEHNVFRRLPVVTETILDIASPDGIHVWCVGFGGLILHSDDGGRAWVAQATNNPNALRAVHFFDESRGWVIGDNDTALETTNGGRSWHRLNSLSQVGSGAALYSIHFLDDRTGWIPGRNGVLWTRDGGQSWERRGKPRERPIYFRDEANGWGRSLNGTVETQDGGRTWHTMPGFKNIILRAVSFGDRSHGWAVDFEGVIRATADGGRTWNVQYRSAPLNRIKDVQFLDSSYGWAWGTTDEILRTTNGGRRWERHTIRTASEINKVHFADSSRGWAVGWKGAILSTGDGGRTWWTATAGLRNEFTSMFFADASHGWVTGMGGTILATQNGGRTWEPQRSGESGNLHAVDFVDLNHGWAAGEKILSTTDGGKTWSPQKSFGNEYISSLEFLDRDRGWAIGSVQVQREGGGTGTFVLATSDGGQQWRRSQLDAASSLEAVRFVGTTTTGWAVGESFAVTKDGRTWQPREAPVASSALSLVPTANGWLGWAAGFRGTIVRTQDGSTWKPIQSPTSQHLRSVHFLDPRHGWIAGDNGTLFATSNGGNTWRSGEVSSQADLMAVQFVDRSHGWLAGAHGTLLRTEDEGLTWSAPRYRRWPAPWFYLTCLISLLLLVPALRQPVTDSEEPDSVAGRLISDRPWREGDSDPLEFRPVALGISRFLRNESTEPPVTLAITGAWGTGKSSLMNLVRDDLADRDFCPVWFNAWHHQQEESLLAALLQAVQAQAIPRWWRPEAWIFRANLLRIRGWRHWVPLLVASALFAFSLAFVTRADVGEAVPRVVDELENLVKLVTPPEGKSSPGKISAALILVGSLVALLRGIWNLAVAFGSKPAELLASATRGSRVRDLQAQTTFRQRFASELSDVTQALAPRRMTIFIDDLDRCQPQNVLQVLETVNFLVSSGDCFVVLGLAREQVEAAVGLGFKEVAAEVVRLSEREGVQSVVVAGEAEQKDREAELERLKRVDFARQYLGKLINLEVPVPSPSLQQRRSLLLGEEKAAPRDSVASRLVETLLSLAPLGAILVLVGVVAGSALLGRWLSLESPSEAAPVMVTNQKEPPAPQPVPRGESKKKTEPSPFDEPPAKLAELLPADPVGWRSLGVILPMVVVLMVAAAWVLTRRPDVVVRDSPAFKEALGMWHPIISEACPTPRALKRFLNRVRYLAMRQRIEEDEPALWRVLARKIGVRLKIAAPSPPPPAPPIPEDRLVALAALEALDPNLLTGNSGLSFSDLKGRFAQFSPVFQRAQVEWQKKGQTSIDAYRSKFREIASEVRAS